MKAFETGFFGRDFLGDMLGEVGAGWRAAAVAPFRVKRLGIDFDDAQNARLIGDAAAIKRGFAPVGPFGDADVRQGFRRTLSGGASLFFVWSFVEFTVIF